MDISPIRCAKCVLPSNYPGINFDEAGVCNYCHRVKEITVLGEEKLRETIERYRGGQGKYDCMVALSGGRDSSYVLWYASRKLGLRTLACFVDNGFVPHETHENIKRATENLGVDLVIKKHDLVVNCINHTLKSWMRRPSPGMIGLLCAGCTLGLRRGLLEAAKENGIKMMLYGVGEPEQSFAEKYLSINPHGAITKRSLALGFLKEITSNPTYIFNSRVVVTYAKEFLFRWSNRYQRRAVRDIQPSDLVQVEPFYYMQWDENQIMSVISSELGWERCAHTKNAWRADCTLAIFKNYLYNETVGFSKVEELLSNLIRYNMTTRDDALARLKSDRIISDELVRELFEELGLEVTDLENALRKAKQSEYYLEAE